MGESAEKLGLFAIFSGGLRIWNSSSQTRRDTKLRYTQITMTLYMIWIRKSRGNIPFEEKLPRRAGAAWGSMQLNHLVEGGQLEFGELVGHDDHGPVGDGQEQVLDPLGGVGVQIGQRLVQK